MATIGSLVVHLGVDSRKFSSGLNSARGALSGFSKWAIGAAAGVGGAIAGAFAVKELVGSAREAEQAGKKLAAVIDATGGAAGFTVQELRDYASELQRVTNFEDDATTNAMAMLATFTNIRGDVFKGAIRAAQDLSTVMDQDLKSSVIQIGKALNDPIKGVTALTRVGVSFTQQQKEQIKTLQESGNILGAQKIIMQELNREFGGAAEAAADPLTQLSNVWGDLKETLGTAILPLVQTAAKAIQEWIGPIAENTEAAKMWAQEIKGVLGPAIGILADGLQLVVLDFKVARLAVTALIGEFAKLAQTTVTVANVLSGGALQIVKDFVDDLSSGLSDDVKGQFEDIKKSVQEPWAHEKVNKFFDSIKVGAENTVKAMKKLGPEMNPLQYATPAGPGGGGLPPIPGLLNKPTKADPLEDARNAAERIKRETRTPIEAFNEEFTKLKSLLENGLIKPETFERAIKDMLKDMSPKDLEKIAGQRGFTGLDLTSNKFQAAGAFNLRTAEGQRSAFSSLVGAKFSGGKDTQKKIEANTTKMAGYLRDIAQKSNEKVDITTVHF